jgi:hypothetical protein
MGSKLKIKIPTEYLCSTNPSIISFTRIGLMFESPRMGPN